MAFAKTLTDVSSFQDQPKLLANNSIKKLFKEDKSNDELSFFAGTPLS